MTFKTLCNSIKNSSDRCRFQDATKELEKIIFDDIKKDQLIKLVKEIGIIPESIAHDSKEEKLYAKVSDIILSRCFYELNMNVTVIKERANNADILVSSKYHNYSLVADAKAFRLSRTAKNQKDFKVESMSHWKGDNDYSVLVVPYFQYPQHKSQIYGQFSNNLISISASASDMGLHPTQKPLSLMELLIELVTKEKQLVLDPFCGSGTTLLAAKLLNRCFIGIEKEKSFYEIARKRVENAENQNLFTL